MAKTEQNEIAKLAEELALIVKKLEAVAEKSTSNFEKTALKTYKGTINRVAKDLSEMAA